MAETAQSMAPFVLLDDARAEGAAQAHLYRGPIALFVAHRPVEVEPVLQAARIAQAEHGGTLAGYLAYEAGLAMEPKLAQLAAARCGAGGPLVWLGLFAGETVFDPTEVEDWLASTAQGTATLGPLDPQLSQGAYEEAFATLQEAIRAGDIYQANLTLPLAGSYAGDPVALYAALRPAAQAGYGGLIYDGSHWLLSLSPELFVSLKGGEARTKPMKGTRPRSPDATTDATLRRDLESSDKDRAENLMIVDLMRNDLGRVAQVGSVKVERLFEAEPHPSVWQLVSTIRATLREEKGVADLLRACWPPGSMTGAPKVRAMEIIEALEPVRRGPYAGAIGYFDASGAMDLSVVIRTAIVHGARVMVQLGGAVVADSDPARELAETEAKGRFIVQALRGS